MSNYKLIIHDEKFTWCMTCESDQKGPIHMVECEFARDGVVIHEYYKGNLNLSIYGKRYEYHEEENE